LIWEPIKLGQPVQAGFVWTSTGPLDLALAIKSSFGPAAKPITLHVAAELARIDAGALTPLFGTAKFAGTFPVPDFLSSGSLAGRLPPAEIELTAVDASQRTRVLKSSSPGLVWDAIRVAAFVLQAWAHKHAAGDPASFLGRVDRHMLPLLGEPEGVIKAFPLFGESNMGLPRDFKPWKDSVLTTQGNAAGALTFLWHLRALLTGNENPKFWDGSFYFALTGPAVAGVLPNRTTDSLGPFNPAPGTTGAWFAIRDHAPGAVLLTLELRNAGGACPSIPLARVDATGCRRPAPSIRTPRGLKAPRAGAKRPNGAW
jgi:hypothetical protein